MSLGGSFTSTFVAWGLWAFGLPSFVGALPSALHRPKRFHMNGFLPNAQKWQHKRIGLLGGSFNPAHGGHVHISEWAMRRLGLDGVWWLVSPQNPLKATAGMAEQAVRVARAVEVAHNPHIYVTDIEAQLGTRYAVDTVAALKRLHPTTEFIWLMGADNLAGFHLWKSWQKLAAMLPIAVLLRPGYRGSRWSTPAAAWFRHFLRPERQARQWQLWRTPALVIVTLPLDERSATSIRAADPHWDNAVSLTLQKVPPGAKSDT